MRPKRQSVRGEELNRKVEGCCEKWRPEKDTGVSSVGCRLANWWAALDECRFLLIFYHPPQRPQSRQTRQWNNINMKLHSPIAAPSICKLSRKEGRELFDLGNASALLVKAWGCSRAPRVTLGTVSGSVTRWISRLLWLLFGVRCHYNIHPVLESRGSFASPEVALSISLFSDVKKWFIMGYGWRGRNGKGASTYDIHVVLNIMDLFYFLWPPCSSPCKI